MKTPICWARIIPGRRYKIPIAALAIVCAAGVLAQDPALLPTQKLDPLARLALGSKEIGLQQYPQAIEDLKAAGKDLPQLSDYAFYLEAAAEFELHQYAQIESLTKQVWERRPASPLAEKAIILCANAFLQDGKPQDAIELVTKHRTQLQIAEAESLLGHAWELAGNPANAANHFERIFSDYPLSKEDADAESELANLGIPPLKVRLKRALNLLTGGDAGRANTELTALIPVLEGSDRDLARLKAAEARYRQSRYVQACADLKSAEVAPPSLAAERLYYLVRCASKLNRPEAFETYLKQLAQSHAESSWRLKAMATAAGYYWALNQPGLYVPLYQTCAEAFAAEGEGQTCRWRVIWADYLARTPNSSRELQAFIQRYPTSGQVPAALYFLGRLAESAKDYQAARAYFLAIQDIFPNHFYGTLARARLAEPDAAPASVAPESAAWLHAVPFRDSVWKQSFQASEISRWRIGRARQLETAGLADLAESELRFGSKVDGQPQVDALELAEMAGRRNTPSVGIRYIKQLDPGYMRMPLGPATDHFWKLAFPLPFRAAVEQFSQQLSLDPFMVAALIRQESEFDPNVVSRSQAYGLTQVLPSTGREISRKLNLRPFQPAMLFVPETNLRIGTYFLRSLLDRLQGKWAAALASYNAGPARAAKWLTWSDYREPAEFIESIPYDETRNYVQSVLRNADLYRRLYGSTDVALASSDGDLPSQSTGRGSGASQPAPALP